MNRSRWFLLSSACGLALVGSPGLAQDASAQAGQAGAAASESDAIIVTARRQNERLQDVPASVAVITADALQRTGAVKAEDFVKLTPGVTIVTGTAEAGDTQNPAFYEDVNKHPFNFYNNIRATNDQKSFDISAKLDQELSDSLKLVGWVLYSDVKQDLVADGTSADFGRFLSAANASATGAAAGVASCFSSTAALTGYPVNQPGFIGKVPVPFLFAPATGSTFGPYSPTTCDGTQYQVRNQRDFSTELRLIGSAGSINWQVGAYYLNIKRTVGVSLGADTGKGVIKQLYNGPNTTNPTPLLLADEFKTNVYAAFGSIEYNPNEKFNAGIALRYDIEDRKSSSLVPTATDPFTGGPINPGQAFGRLTDKQARFEQFEPKVTLSYKPNSDLNLYANWGIGFKSGGFNNQGSAQVIRDNFVNAFGANVTITDQYDKEWSSAWEAGLKGNLLNGKVTFDLAGYYT